MKSDLQDLRERQVRLAARVPLGRLGQREPREIREPPDRQDPPASKERPDRLGRPERKAKREMLVRQARPD